MHDSRTSQQQALLLTPRDAAKLLAVSSRTLWSLTIPRGRLRSVRIGRSVRYDVRDLETWIEKQKQQTP